MHFFSYIGPDQIIPLATPIAMVLGFAMMFWRGVVKVVAGVANGVLSVFKRRDLTVDAKQSEEATATIAFPRSAIASSHVASSHFDQSQSIRRAA